jgi:hypothetical protein
MRRTKRRQRTVGRGAGDRRAGKYSAIEDILGSQGQQEPTSTLVGAQRSGGGRFDCAASARWRAADRCKGERTVQERAAALGRDSRKMAKGKGRRQASAVRAAPVKSWWCVLLAVGGCTRNRQNGSRRRGTRSGRTTRKVEGNRLQYRRYRDTISQSRTGGS